MLDRLRNLFRAQRSDALSGERLAMRQLAAAKPARGFPSWSQWRTLPSILSSKERMFFRGVLGSILMGLVLVLVGFFQAYTIAVPKAGGKIIEGVVGYPQLINPLYALSNDADHDIASLIYSGLLKFDAVNGTYVPDLASNISTSEDGKIYTVTLRSDARWHDKEPVVMEDILFTFNAIKNPNYGSPLRDAFADVTVAQVDETTLTFTLTQPYAAFPSLLTTGILPAHLWTEIAPVNARLTGLNIKPIGSGPYAFGKLSKDSKGSIRSISLVPSATYETKALIKEIVFKFFPDTFSLNDAVKNKHVTRAAGIPLSSARSMSAQAVSVATPALTQYVGAFFNTKRGALAQTEVRQALGLALDRPTIASYAIQSETTAIAFALPGFAATAPVVDVAQAETLLDTAGWKRNDQGARSKAGAPLSLTILSSQLPEYARLAEKMQQAWQALGIIVQITSVDDATLLLALKERNFDVLITAERYGGIADPYPFWQSTQSTNPGLNITQFSSKTMDEAVGILRTSSTAETRAQAYQTLAQEITTQVPAIFFYQSHLVIAQPSNLTTTPLSTLTNSSDRFFGVETWYVKTKRVLK